MTTGADGVRTLAAHCELDLDGEHIARDSIQSAHADWHPLDAMVRIQRNGRWSGSGWFRFTDTQAECEALSADAGRISQRMAIERPLRGFGTHALQADAWLAAGFPFERGPGHRHFWGVNLLHSTHHLGATGPAIATTRSGLAYVGPETVAVPAGRFDCHRLRFVGFTNDHPPYDMWITRAEAPLYVRGEVGGYMSAHFELAQLD